MKFFPYFLLFHPVWIKFSTGDSYTNVSGDGAFCDKKKPHIVVLMIFCPCVSHLLASLGEIQNEKSLHTFV